jgi:hypothetical protein
MAMTLDRGAREHQIPVCLDFEPKLDTNFRLAS